MPGELVAFQLLLVSKECPEHESVELDTYMMGSSLPAEGWVRLALNSLSPLLSVCGSASQREQKCWDLHMDLP